ncbi:MAG: HYR domain-containing protein [Flavobacteriales bacterium]
MCSNAGPFSLNSLLTGYGSGSAVSVANSSNVVSPNGALGAVLGSYAQFNNAGGSVTVDLGVTVPTGTTLSVLWRSSGLTATANILFGTTTNPTNSAGAISTASNSAIYSDITLSGPARYIRLQRPGTGSAAFEVDGIYYSYGNDLNGTWSGPGVSGSTFNPAGLSGNIALTYTVGTGSCASSTTASIPVTAAANAGTNGTLSTCSGSPAASLFAQLGGAPQTGGTWSGPSPVTGGMYDPSTMTPGNYTYTVAPTGVCVGSATATAVVTVGASPSGGTFTGAGIVCPSPATGTLTISGHTGSIVRWGMSTNGGSSWSSLGTTATSITWTNLTGPTQFRVELSQPGCGVGYSPTAVLTPQDLVAPTLVCPLIEPVETAFASSTCTMRVPDLRAHFAASDNCSTPPSISQSPAPGTIVPFVEDLEVLVRATDASGNESGTCPARVIGVDTIPAIFACPADQVLNTASGSCSAQHTITPINYSDNCWGNGTAEKVFRSEGSINIIPMSEFDPIGWNEVSNALVQTFAEGDHTIVHVHANGLVDIALCSYILRVVDMEPPVVACGASITLNTDTGSCTASMPDLTTQVGRADNCGIQEIVQDPAVGAVVSGTFDVTFTVTDVNGLSTQCQQSVSVVDPEPPTISCPPNVVTTTTAGSCSANVSYAIPTAADNCSLVSVTRIAGPVSGAAFPLGSTTITYRAVDGSNNSVTCSFTVTVSDPDSDSDGTTDCSDLCPSDPNKITPGICGCGVSDIDTDSDGTADCNDACPNDPNKVAPGICGCGVSDVDTDSDGTADCNDACPNDPNKVAPGICGCGVSDVDTDSDGTADCNDACPNDLEQGGSRHLWMWRE